MTTIHKVKSINIFDKAKSSLIKPNNNKNSFSTVSDDNSKKNQIEIFDINKSIYKNESSIPTESEKKELLNKKYHNIISEGLNIVGEQKIGDDTIVVASSNDNYSKIYMYSKDYTLIGNVKVPKNGNISSISYDDKIGEISVVINGEKVNYTLDMIKNSINNNSNYILPDFKSEAYQQQLKKSIDLYNQADGIAADVYISEIDDTFRGAGCGTASLMIAFANLSGNFVFNPVEFIQDAVKQGYLTHDGNDSSMLPIKGPENIIRNKWKLDINEIKCDSQSIINALKEGKKVMFNVNINGGFYDSEAGHYVLLDHYDKETDQIFVVDPIARPGYKNPERTGYKSINFLEEEMFSIPNNPPVEIDYMGTFY